MTEIQRSRMLTAAVDAVDEVGYARMTVAQVISRARVSRKTFYDVFADREDCFMAAFDQALEEASALALDAYEQQPQWRDGMRAGLARLLMFMDAEPSLAKLCVVEALGAGPRVLERRARILDEVAAVIDRGRFLATAPSEPPDVTAEQCPPLAHVPSHRWSLELKSHGPIGTVVVVVETTVSGPCVAAAQRYVPRRKVTTRFPPS